MQQFAMRSFKPEYLLVENIRTLLRTRGIDAKALARTQVLETWVAGKKVWSRPASAVSPERGR